MCSSNGRRSSFVSSARFVAFACAFVMVQPGHTESRLAMAVGYQYWDGISELEPAAGGSFQSGAAVLDASAHWRLNRFTERRILIGLQASGGGDYSSDIEAFVGDLRGTTSYVAASAILAVAENGFIEFGGGSYRVTIRDSRFPGQSIWLVEGAPSSKVHEQRAPGLFIGGGVELESSEKFALTIGAKLHFPDFGDVPELGPKAGSLSEPMLVVQIGLSYLL